MKWIFWLTLLPLFVYKYDKLHCLFMNPSEFFVGRIYSSIAKILKFDWSMQITWKQSAIVNQIRLSRRFLFEHICWYSKRKLTNTPAVIFSCPFPGRWFISTKQVITILFWIIIYSYLQKFFKIGVLKTLHNSQENTCVGVCFYSFSSLQLF